MKKTYIYTIVVIAMIIGAGSLLMGGGRPTTTGNSVGVSSGNENIQEVVIGMKNYNYFPNTIKVNAGQPIKLSLDNSVSGCFRDFTIRSLGIAKYLVTPSDSLEFTIDKPGNYTFACSMSMGTGKIIAE